MVWVHITSAKLLFHSLYWFWMGEEILCTDCQEWFLLGVNSRLSFDRCLSGQDTAIEKTHLHPGSLYLLFLLLEKLFCTSAID